MLVQIKKKYDPTNLLRLNQNIKSDGLLVEDPGAGSGQRACRIFDDRDGLNPARLPEHASVVFVTPSHQFPTGAILPLARGARYAIHMNTSHHIESGSPFRPKTTLSEHWLCMAKWNYVDFQVVLIAPLASLSKSSSELEHFDFANSYEDIGEFVPAFKDACSTDHPKGGQKPTDLGSLQPRALEASCTARSGPEWWIATLTSTWNCPIL